MELRAFLDLLREKGQLTVVEKSVSPHLEMARFIAAHECEALLFTEVPGYEGYVVSGICSRRDFFALALGVKTSELIPTLTQAMENLRPPPVVSNPPCQEVIEDEVDLTRLPILKHLPDDGGPYVTAGVAIIKDPDYGRNMCFHRLMLLDKRRFTAR
ncbi:MAG TPA: UbiD family decarboxylase, partial [Chloroflexi bacterium]|nr:UbiD family decarboxylase [Chloroflexota bacterium]